MTQAEFQAILADATKRIDGDISWAEDEDHSPSVEFRAELLSDPGYPIFIRGSYNSLIPALTYALIHRGVGRVYGLDLGKDHHNPSCQNVGENHKHQWDDVQRDKEAYVPPDITAAAQDVVAVWGQFCKEAGITHNGVMHSPPPIQQEIF